MSNNKVCLNCGNIVNSKFCPECGQNADTERFSVKHLFKNDLTRKAFRFSGNFFFTAKKLLTTPGYSIRSYVAGKRVRYLNYLDILLLLVALDITLLNMQGDKIINNHSLHAKSFGELLAKYSNIMYIVTIPITSVITLLFFRKAKQNFAEHVVMNTYKTAGSLIITSILYLIMCITNEKVSGVLVEISGFCALIYSFWFYYQYFKQNYNLSVGYVLRITFAILISLALSMIMLFTLFYWFNKPGFDKLIYPGT